MAWLDDVHALIFRVLISYMIGLCYVNYVICKENICEKNLRPIGPLQGPWVKVIFQSSFGPKLRKSSISTLGNRTNYVGLIHDRLVVTTVINSKLHGPRFTMKN